MQNFCSNYAIYCALSLLRQHPQIGFIKLLVKIVESELTSTKGKSLVREMNEVMKREIRHILFEHTLNVEVNVPFDVILIDLWFLDEQIVGWQEEDRQYALAGGILRRNFVDDVISALKLVDVWRRLRRAYSITNIDDVVNLSNRIYEYAKATSHSLPGVVKHESM